MIRRCIWILTCCAWTAACADAEEISGRFRAQLSEDVIVELVGIRSYAGGQPRRTRKESGPWWSPEGTPLATAPDGRFDACSWRDAYLFLILVEGGTDLDFKAIGPWDHDLTVVPTREFEKGKGLEDKDLRRFTLRAGNQKSIDIRLGVATGEWKTTDSWSIGPDWTPYNIVLCSTEKAILRCPEQRGPDVVTEITEIVTERATRLLLSDKDGNRYKSNGEILGEADGLVRRVHRFRKLDKSKIERIEFQARVYNYWVTFRNVSLESDRETQVEVDVSKPGALLKGNTLPGFDDAGLDSLISKNRDKALLFCFFDMNQRPSRRCIGELAKQAGQLKKKSVAVIPIQASKVNQDILDEWKRRNNILFPVGMIDDNEQETRFAWGVKSLPWLILTDRQHIVKATGFSLNELTLKIKQANGG
ncbi:MAG: hypothetical protein JSW47_16095 [Phycisphaerales bacterium]|nr:MAG: hypothetical protein JSW47_16095 [Phycisphaerales bacterium]